LSFLVELTLYVNLYVFHPLWLSGLYSVVSVAKRVINSWHKSNMSQFMQSHMVSCMVIRHV